LVSKAIDYLQKAGDAASRVYANVEAVAHYTRALELAKLDEANSEELIHLYTRLGRSLEFNAQFDQALTNYEEMERLAQQRGNRPLELSAMMARGTLYTTPTPSFELEQGEVLLKRALTLAHELDDRVAETRILWNLSNLYRFSTGRRSQAIDYGERALAVARELNLREQMAFILNDLSSCYRLLYRFDQAKAASHEARVLWQELGNLPMLTDSLSASCQVCFLTGEFDQVIAFSEEAFQISQSISNLWGQSYSQLVVGPVYWERGEPDRAIAVLEESIRLGELIGFIHPQINARADLAVVYGGLGAIERGLEIARLAITVAETYSYPGERELATLAHLHLWQDNLVEAEVALEQGKRVSSLGESTNWSVILADAELALRQGDYQRAVTVTDNFLATLRETGMQAFIPNTLYLQGQALQALGRERAAHGRLVEARTEAEAIGSRRTLWPILFTLSQLETDPTEADRLRQGAQEIVEYIADHVSGPELRALFLNSPRVQVVFEPIANE
jgi:tetratricopeptide (TPR) repeat protein